MQPAIITRNEPSKALIIAAFAAIYIIWGSTYIAMLFAIRDIPPMLMLGIRFTVAGLILFTYSRLRGEPLPDSSSITKISFSGVLMLFVGTGAVAWVEQYIPSGLAAIIVATVPLWFVILDKKKWKSNFNNKWIISGLVIGFAGVLTLFGDSKAINLSGDRMKLASVIVLAIGTISWTAGSLYSKYAKMEGSSTMKAALQMSAAGIVSILASLVSGEYRHTHWSSVSWNTVFALIYLVTIGSLVGYMAYVWLLSVRPPALVGTYAYVNPVVAVFLGWLLVGEQISRQQVIALAIILAGVILVTLSKGKE
jgi:drug/metabolite transporter (DMT)-like permease